VGVVALCWFLQELIIPESLICDPDSLLDQPNHHQSNLVEQSSDQREKKNSSFTKFLPMMMMMMMMIKFPACS
jgi:hypothetical protein